MEGPKFGKSASDSQLEQFAGEENQIRLQPSISNPQVSQEEEEEAVEEEEEDV